MVSMTSSFEACSSSFELGLAPNEPAVGLRRRCLAARVDEEAADLGGEIVAGGARDRQSVRSRSWRARIFSTRM